MDLVDHVYYINLDHRTDRKEQIESEFQKVGIPANKITRISGIYKKEFGILGCGLSHKKALETFLASPYKNCMIFEDDFTFTLDFHYCQYLIRQVFHQDIPYDLVMLAGNIFSSEPSPWPFLKKVKNGQTASAFLITKDFAPQLIHALEESTKLLEDYWKETGQKKHEYCNDIYWKKLQPQSNWFIVHPKMGIQRESYSDNEYKVTNYGV